VTNPCSSANLADACLKLGIAYHCPAGLRPAVGGVRLAGPVLPVCHAGSVDVFLEAIEQSATGDILLVDNDGRRDEGCIGDLVTLEAERAGIAGIVIWGCHRDQLDIAEIGLPLFSLGNCPSGPRGPEGRTAAIGDARIDGFAATRGMLLVGDDDGVILVSANGAAALTEAAAIRAVEQKQATRMRAGRSLRAQIGFANFLEARATDAALTLRDHLKRVGGAVET
jgi:4-hydroxy-4-methyl-2-oxoglutarate aldolase